MEIENTAPDAIREMIHPLRDGKFQFACHPGVPCFTECCRDLKLLLTPYDILRLKTRLAMSAEDFIEDHADTEFDERHGLPMLYLTMQANERRTCPFVSPQGCTVYEDRPSACRIYPIARASRMHRVHGAVLESFYVLKEPHCRGFEEERIWSVEDWVGDQGLKLYHDMNNLWMEIVTHPRMKEASNLSPRQQQMFFMASYNLDRFRAFAFQSRFLQLFELEEGEREAIEADDAALLRLAFKWLKFSLLNEQSLQLKQP